MGYFLATHLIQDKHSVALVEKDSALCDQLAQELKALIINGDGCDPHYLEEAGIEHADVVAAVTGDDEDNLVICQLAKERFYVRRTVARVNDPKNERVFNELGVDVPIDATAILAKIIEEEVSFSDFVSLLSFKRGKLSLVRLDLPPESPVINKALKDIRLPEQAVLLSIIRGQEVIIPKGDTVFKVGDDVIALTFIENEKQLILSLIGTI